jgi:CBS domain-containing protein/sporulation protein YlmC with PRC-barrel domain
LPPAGDFTRRFLFTGSKFAAILEKEAIMPFISQIIGRPVVDSEGEKLGRVEEVLATQGPGMLHPVLVALVVSHNKEIIRYPFNEIAVLFAPVIPLSHTKDKLPRYQPTGQEVQLIMDVLDKQIIDTNGIRVVRVNDLELARVNGDYYVANVDIGWLGLVRRMGLSKPVEGFVSLFSKKTAKNYISWDNVELLTHDQFMHLKVPAEKLHELHPADIAEIISDMSHTESGKLLDSLDIEHLADALEEVEPDFQATLIEGMSDEKVADVLEEMSPDEAADLLAELSPERSEDLLGLMQDEEAKDVRMLLSYPEDSAGGMMTTDVATIHPGLTASKAIEVLRNSGTEAESLFYVYVIDEQEHLMGVFSLSDLILAKPNTPITDFMHKKVVTANVLENQDNLAQIVAKYNLLTLPIVDDNNRLLGMVTADDALDKIIPTAWKKRLPRFFYYDRA